MAGGEAEEGVDSAATDPGERRSAEEVQQGEVHRYERSCFMKCASVVHMMDPDSI